MIQYATATQNKILGNYIGTTEAGDGPLPNINAGIAIFNGASNNTIGGTVAGARNVISGNTGDGVTIAGGSSKNILQGNYFGTKADGLVALPNSTNGIILYSSDNTVGGTVAGARNVISGNAENGIRLYETASTKNKVIGNYIGTDKNGNNAIPNINGILISHGASNNSIGDVDVAGGNLISGNTGTGVNIQGSTSVNNLILSNEIFSNGSLGIDLGTDGQTLNDNGDADSGPNNLQNFPILITASSDAINATITITGTLNSTASTIFRLEFFANTAADPSGYG